MEDGDDVTANGRDSLGCSQDFDRWENERISKNHIQLQVDTLLSQQITNKSSAANTRPIKQKQTEQITRKQRQKITTKLNDAKRKQMIYSYWSRMNKPTEKQRRRGKEKPWETRSEGASSGERWTLVLTWLKNLAGWWRAPSIFSEGKGLQQLGQLKKSFTGS
jgi:hypothetical protein